MQKGLFKTYKKRLEVGQPLTLKMKEDMEKDYIEQADKLFSRYIREKASNQYFQIKCYICGTVISFEQSQNMHFISRKNWRYRRDEKNCKAGCYRCNIALNGNYMNYTIKMIEEYGKDEVDNMIEESKKIYKKPTIEQLGNLIEKLKEILKI